MDNNQQCNTENTCKKGGLKCLVPFIAVFATMFAFNWVYHGIYMMPDYQATASQWRPMEEMEKLAWVCFLTKAVMSAIICCLFCCMAKGSECQGKCYKKGAKFGFKIGLLLGAQQFASYIFLPISMELAVKWLIGDILLGVLIGLVLTALKRTCKQA